VRSVYANIGATVQTSCAIGTGILLETFLVRAVMLPAMAVLVGQANWWPSRWRPRPPAKRTEQKSARDARR
jgi:RND superfamily putative drug exporter